MKLNKSKILIVLVLTVFLFSFLSSFVLAAERGLEAEYPKLDGEEITTTTTIPEYVSYIFKFSLIIAAVAAFAVLIYGGFRYLTSAGSPGIMRDAKSWIYGGILGLVLLLCSYLILITINPELLSPKAEPLEPTEGIYLINGKEEKLHLLDSKNGISFDAKKVEFLSPKDKLYSVFVSNEEEFDVNEESSNKVREIKNPGKGGISDIPLSLKSIHFLWSEPGIYLYAKENQGTPPVPKLFQSSTPDLEEFNDKAKSFRTVNILDPETGLGQTDFFAILFKEPNFNKDNKGKCGFAHGNKSNFNEDLLKNVKNEVSSIAVFDGKVKEIYGEIKFYDEIDCKGSEYSEEVTGSTAVTLTDTQKPPSPGKDKVDVWNSMSINANATVVLSTEEIEKGKSGLTTGYCTLFTGIGCVANNLKESSIYHECWLGPLTPFCEAYQPKQANIYPIMK